MRSLHQWTAPGRSAGLLGALLVAASTAWGQAAPAGAGTPPPATPGGAPDLPRKLEDFGEWRALAVGSGETRSCYLTQKQTPTAPAGRAKDRPLLYVTHRPGKSAYYVVSYFAGYAIKPGSDIELDFGAAKFRLFVQAASNSAWSPSPEIDSRIVDAMKAAWSLTIRGQDASGAEIADTFSMTGFSNALWRASHECGVR